MFDDPVFGLRMPCDEVLHEGLAIVLGRHLAIGHPLNAAGLLYYVVAGMLDDVMRFDAGRDAGRADEKTHQRRGDAPRWATPLLFKNLVLGPALRATSVILKILLVRGSATVATRRLRVRQLELPAGAAPLLALFRVRVEASAAIADGGGDGLGDKFTDDRPKLQRNLMLCDVGYENRTLDHARGPKPRSNLQAGRSAVVNTADLLVADLLDLWSVDGDPCRFIMS